MQILHYTFLGLSLLLLTVFSLLITPYDYCKIIKWYFIYKFLICNEENIQGFYIDQLWLYHYKSYEITPGKERRFEEITKRKVYSVNIDSRNDFIIELREKVKIQIVVPYVIHKAIEDVYNDFYKTSLYNENDKCYLWFKNIDEVYNYIKSVELCDLIMDYLLENFYLNSTVIQYRKESTPFYYVLNSNGYVIKEILKFMRNKNSKYDRNGYNYSHCFKMGKKYKIRNYCMVNCNSVIDEKLRYHIFYREIKDNKWESQYKMFHIGSIGKFSIVMHYYFLSNKNKTFF